MLVLVVFAVAALTIAMLLAAVWVAHRRQKPLRLDHLTPARHVRDSQATETMSETTPVAPETEHPHEGI